MTGKASNDYIRKKDIFKLAYLDRCRYIHIKIQLAIEKMRALQKVNFIATSTSRIFKKGVQKQQLVLNTFLKSTNRARATPPPALGTPSAFFHAQWHLLSSPIPSPTSTYTSGHKKERPAHCCSGCLTAPALHQAVLNNHVSTLKEKALIWRMVDLA